MYWLRGVSLNSREFDFSKIQSITLRKEALAYFRDKLAIRADFRNDGNIAILTTCLNFLTENNPKIRYCCDIRKSDVLSLVKYLELSATTQYNTSMSVRTVMNGITACKGLLNFLSKEDDHPCKYPKPKTNFFNDVVFKNTLWHSENTKIIPDVVIDQMNLYVHELSKPLFAAYKVLESTGMRISEVTKLESNSVDYNAEYAVWTLSYIPSKVLSARKRKMLPDGHMVVIPESVAQLVLDVEKESEDLRITCNVPYVFIQKIGNGVPKQMQGASLASSLNKIAQRHNIIDKDGVVWNFTTRQYRKTIAVNMVENGASLQEISTQFGHIGDQTPKLYYAEVRRKKLAELNHAFFEKKFNIAMGPDKLSKFTEEERRRLYVDFCISQRDVELGVCLKHASDGPCGKRTGRSNCAVCTNLCTGTKYLDKWDRLVSSQKKLVNELLATYQRNGIEDYVDFREYQREQFLLDSYEAVVARIHEGGK